MTSRTRYETLVASLPYLPRVDRAERLPINRERLEARLRMLSERDAAGLERAVRLLQWRREPAPPAAEQRAWQEALEDDGEPALHALLAFHRDVRTVLGALRQRRRGLAPAATPGGPPVAWGAGPWLRHIVQHWDDPDFRLGPVFPWIGAARTHLASGAAADLERLLCDLEWRLLERLAEPEPFGFAAVVAYRFKWGLLERLLAYDRGQGQARFEQLIEEGCGDALPNAGF
jgi:hypothetical protein